MIPQAPVFYGGNCNIRLGVKGIYGMKMKRGWKCVNTTQPLIITVLV